MQSASAAAQGAADAPGVGAILDSLEGTGAPLSFGADGAANCGATWHMIHMLRGIFVIPYFSLGASLTKDAHSA